MPWTITKTDRQRKMEASDGILSPFSSPFLYPPHLTLTKNIKTVISNYLNQPPNLSTHENDLYDTNILLQFTITLYCNQIKTYICFYLHICISSTQISRDYILLVYLRTNFESSRPKLLALIITEQITRV